VARCAPLVTAACLAAAGCAGAAPAAASPVWTQVASGTTGDISAIDYRGDGIVFTTTGGQIFRRVNGAFQQVLNDPGVVFNDIEMRGQSGVAVGNAGVIYSTADGGASWARATVLKSNLDDCLSEAPLADVVKVAFASDSVAYIFAGHNQILRSSATPLAPVGADGTWDNYNVPRPGACRIATRAPITPRAPS